MVVANTTHRHEYQAEHFTPSKKEVRRLGLIVYYQEKVGRWSVGAEQADPNIMYQKLIVMCKKKFGIKYSKIELEKDYVGIGFRNIIRTFNKRLSKASIEKSKQSLYDKCLASSSTTSTATVMINGLPNSVTPNVQIQNDNEYDISTKSTLGSNMI
jgi:hypothetical protein